MMIGEEWKNMQSNQNQKQCKCIGDGEDGTDCRCSKHLKYQQYSDSIEHFILHFRVFLLVFLICWMAWLCWLWVSMWFHHFILVVFAFDREREEKRRNESCKCIKWPWYVLICSNKSWRVTVLRTMRWDHCHCYVSTVWESSSLWNRSCILLIFSFNIFVALCDFHELAISIVSWVKRVFWAGTLFSFLTYKCTHETVNQPEKRRYLRFNSILG